ncbi:phage related tail fibre protein [Kordia algicida OT-1]|uniref:Phage related tail fibre protein n=2 Tax=Kordia TaxID=221065 RepID=A9E1Z3_9FLAO|nr:phage related tail fibre protein [Kordia algicida OT-1]
MNAQVGIGTTTPNSSSELEIVSNDKGILIPRIGLSSSSDSTTIGSGNVESLLVYNTATSGDITPGYYYWDGAKWQRLTVADDVDIKEPWYGTDDNAAATSNTEDMYLMSSKVGIGTTTPEARLNLIQSGSIAYGNLENAALLIGTTANGIGLDNNQIAKYGGTLFFESEDGFTLSTDVNSNGEVNVNTADKVMSIAKTGDVRIDYNLHVLEKVGVGTTSPVSKLQVVGSDGQDIFRVKGPGSASELIFNDLISGGYPSGLSNLTSQSDGMLVDLPQFANLIFKIRNNDQTDGFHIVNNTGDHVFTANANRRMSIGFASDVPEATLDVASATRTGTHAPTSTFYVTGNYGQRSNGAEFVHTNGTQGVGIGWEGIYKTSSAADSNLSLSSKGTGSVYTYTNNAARMTVDGDGEVGVGTTNPTERLHVNNGQLYITTPSNNMLRFQIGYDGFSYGNRSSDFGVLFESASSGFPGSVARISAGDQSTGTANGNKYLGFQVGRNKLNSDTKLMYLSSVGGGRVGINTESPSYTLHVNGSVAGTSAYVNTSDARLKTNILPLENALSKIMSLQGVTFDWNSNRSVGKQLELDDKNHIGFIAQQVESVLPEVVSTDDSSSEKIKSVAYADIVPVLVEAIKELNKKIDQLEDENTQLKASLNSIDALKVEIKNMQNKLKRVLDVTEENNAK